jgi:hypothetical protein
MQAVIRVCPNNPRYDEEYNKFAKSVRQTQRVVVRYVLYFVPEWFYERIHFNIYMYIHLYSYMHIHIYTYVYIYVFIYIYMYYL